MPMLIDQTNKQNYETILIIVQIPKYFYCQATGTGTGTGNGTGNRESRIKTVPVLTVKSHRPPPPPPPPTTLNHEGAL